MADASRRIVDRIQTVDLYCDSLTVALYVPVRNEPDLLSLLADTEKRFCAPVVQKDSRVLCFREISATDDLVPGAWNIPEPRENLPEVPIPDISLFLAPGVAFSQEGERIGYGGGYYDATLKHRRKNAKTMGVAYDSQLVESGFADTWDIRMDRIVTQTRYLSCLKQN